MPKLDFHYINLLFVLVLVRNSGLSLYQNQKEGHWRRLMNHLKFDVFANSTFVFNFLSPKRHKF